MLYETALMRAYAATDFVVAAGPMGVLRVGEDGAGAAALLRRCGAERGAVISGENPFSETDIAGRSSPNDPLVAIRRLGRKSRPVWGVPRVGDWPPEQSALVLDCTEAEAARIAYGARQNAYVWVEAGQVPELRLTVSGCLVVATRRLSDRAPTELACLTEEGGALWLSLRRYAVLATFARHPWYAAPDMIDGNVVAGIDLTPEPRSGLVVGGPLAPVPEVPVERVDPTRPREALPWFLRLGWVAGHERLCAVLGA